MVNRYYIFVEKFIFYSIIVLIVFVNFKDFHNGYTESIKRVTGRFATCKV